MVKIDAIHDDRIKLLSCGPTVGRIILEGCPGWDRGSGLALSITSASIRGKPQSACDSLPFASACKNMTSIHETRERELLTDGRIGGLRSFGRREKERRANATERKNLQPQIQVLNSISPSHTRLLAPSLFVLSFF